MFLTLYCNFLSNLNTLERDWRDFKSLHGNISGARDAFEKACESLFRSIHENENVQQVEVKQGDGGIDIYIGQIGISPITVIQCKFFLEEFEVSQKNQVRDSFNRAKENTEYELESWVLCIPRILDLDQNIWWNNWKNKKSKEYLLSDNFVRLINGNELIDLFKKYNLYNQVFQIEDSILIEDTNKKVTETLNILKKERGLLPKTIECSRININKILFNNYTLENELYYFERNVDKYFIANLKIGNIWIYGSSGVGKTALVNRNLLVNDIEYITCDLSPITIDCIEVVFDEIISEIKTKYQNVGNSSSTNKIKQIESLLNSLNFQKEIVIVIDELSLPNSTLQFEFADSIIRLVSYYNSRCNNNYLKFIISTISEPLEIIKNKAKASEHFCYISSNDWNAYFESFLNNLLQSLGISISDYDKSLILAECKNNARLLKNVLRKIVISDEINSIIVESAVKESLKEYF